MQSISKFGFLRSSHIMSVRLRADAEKRTCDYLSTHTQFLRSNISFMAAIFLFADDDVSRSTYECGLS